MADQQTPAASELSAHDAAMAAKADALTAAAAAAAGVQPEQAEKPQRPDHVPEKFWDAEKGAINTEALLKSYSELEKGHSKPAEQKPPEGLKVPEGQPANAEEAVKAAKLDMATLQQEFASSGALSEASYKALEGAGIGKEVVDQYIAGQVALAESRNQQGYTLAGGSEQYGQMIQWAASNLSQAEQAAFNSAVDGSVEQMSMAITSLKARYEAAVGRDPAFLGGQRGGSGSEGDTPFASRAEVTAAMRDSRYRNDPAYRAMVERRVGLMEDF